MNARQIEQAAKQLRELKAQIVEDMGLGVMAFGAALAASQYRPSFAIPFLLGAMGVTFLGLRAFVRRTFLVEDLAASRDAYLIPDVRRFALRAASPEHRRQLARSLRVALAGPPNEGKTRLVSVRGEIEELVAALEDDGSSWDPETVVMLERWLNDPAGPLLDRSTPVVELRSRLRAILSAFENSSLGSQ